MRGLLGAILTAVVLVAVVTGCGGAPGYDGRLVAADSLMHDRPDSALALVQAVSADSLTGEADRAYRDLLLTQARYRCYVTATSDSAINRALSYYRAHDGEREKLTRCYIYKGAVMEELGHPDSAMYYYKHAEATAAPDDYFNLGYVKMRIATLYQNQVSQDSSAIIRLQESLKYFSLLRDSANIIPVLGSLGAINGSTAPDTAINYLEKAICLAKAFDPKLQYSQMSTLAGVYFYKNDYMTANKFAMDVLRNGRDYCDETQFYHYAIMSYIKLGYLDSAKYVFKLMPVPVDAVDSMNYYDILAEIAEAEQKHSLYKEYKERSHDITEEILSDSKKGEIAIAEGEFDKMKSIDYYEEKSNSSQRFLFGIVLILLLGTAAIIYFFRCELTKRVKENNDIKTELEKALSDLHEQSQKNKSVSSLVGHRINALRELYHDIRVRIQDDNKVKKIIPLSSVFKIMSERNGILHLNLKDKFWNEMKLSVDGEYNGIYSYVEKNYPNLSDKELKIFCLMCANISPQIIKLCVGITNSRTITNYRSVIIKKKMGHDMSLDTFIKKYVDGDLNNT